MGLLILYPSIVAEIQLNTFNSRSIAVDFWRFLEIELPETYRYQSRLKGLQSQRSLRILDSQRGGELMKLLWGGIPSVRQNEIA